MFKGTNYIYTNFTTIFKNVPFLKNVNLILWNCVIYLFFWCVFSFLYYDCLNHIEFTYKIHDENIYVHKTGALRKFSYFTEFFFVLIASVIFLIFMFFYTIVLVITKTLSILSLFDNLHNYVAVVIPQLFLDNFARDIISFNVLDFQFYRLFDSTELSFLYFYIKFCWTTNLQTLYTSFFSIFQNYLNYPIFIYFGFFFFLTTIFSLLNLFYTGLYGTFILNLVALAMLWCSMIPYIKPIFAENVYYYVSFGKWMYLTTDYRVSFDFLLDIISLSFSFLTITIAIFVYIYTFSYFRYEPLVDRLVLFLNMFIISMAFLVSAGNFIILFLGWEMIGLTSFFLINFWSTRVGTLKAAFKAYSFNKTSDLFLFIVIIVIFNTTFNLDILTFINEIHLYENYTIHLFNNNFNYIEFISLLFIICAFIKSAQFGAHIWLPDSMEAPVPASALIHSATLVSAGIYLLLRFTVLFEFSTYGLNIIAVVGSVTAFYGGFTSMFQADAKRVLAYSTISHCGFLMVVYSTGVVEYTLLYLYVHGFFKAATFLSVGNIIRFSRNTQDFKRMGGYCKVLPFDCVITFVCLINLSGLPLTFGFFIKHLLFVGLQLSTPLYYFTLTNCIFGALTGLFYGSRLFYSVYFDFKKARKSIYVAANRKNLKSKYYTNTTKAATLAIVGLVIVSYFVSVFLLNLFLSKDLFYSDFSNFYYTILTMDYYWSTSNFLLNNSFLNWIVLVLVIMIFFTPWRTTIQKSHYLFNLNYYIIFTLVFYILFAFILG